MAGQCTWTDNLPDGCVSVYLQPAYQALLARNDGTRRAVLKYEDHEKKVFLPLLLRDVNQGTYEAYSAYGYGGFWPRTSLNEDELQTIKDFLGAQNIICAFIRHSPFSENHAWLPHGESELNRITYVRDLTKDLSIGDFCKTAGQKLRWSVNFAKRHGLGVEFFPIEACTPDQIEGFHQLYTGLMLGKGTADYYLFSNDFFIQNSKHLAGQCELAEIRDPAQGRLIAAALFLFDETGWAHYHLSAASPEAMKLQAMELLLAEAIVRYGNAGHRHLHLGGGHTADENDGLSRFKKKFSNRRAAFHCSKWVCDSKRYDYELHRLPVRNPHLFLLSDARSG